MGNIIQSPEGRFVRNLVIPGNEMYAVEMWRANEKNLRSRFDPNEVIEHSQNRDGNTILHLACYHGLSQIVEDLLRVGGGNYADITKTNNKRQNCAHLLMSNAGDAKSRFQILQKLCEYKGHKLDVMAEDVNKNTLLHLAAANGLSDCCMWLIDRGLSRILSDENKDGNVPASEADKNGHHDLAAKIEGVLVYSKQLDHVEATSTRLLLEIKSEDDAYLTHQGMTMRDLRGAKDQNVVSVASFLYGNSINGRNLFNAECLCLAYKWNVASLQQAWLMNSKQACYKAGINPDQEEKKTSGLQKCLTCGEGKDEENGEEKEAQPSSKIEHDPLTKKIIALIKQGKQMHSIIMACKAEGHKAGEVMRAHQKAQLAVMNEAESPSPTPEDPLVTKITQMIQKKRTMPQILSELRAQGNDARKIMKAYQKSQAAIMQGSKKPQTQNEKSGERVQLIPVGACGHLFCANCWKRYLEVKIKEGEVQSIICPAFKCHHRVPCSIIDAPLVDQKTAQRYAKFELRDFVKENADYQWCPAPGCDAAVCRHTGENGQKIAGNTADCGQGHFFCFECKGEPHDPCSCDEWQRWNVEVKEMSAKLGFNDSGGQDAASVATMLWLKTNTKKCPKCKSGIQKNEGCNHMTCRACRHEFCWICMAPWSTHGQKTGGYYKCNVYKGAGPIDNKSEAKQAKKKLEESKRFIHFVERIKAHEDSKRLEQKMLRSAHDKIAEMQKSTIDEVDTSFVGISFRQLYWNRIVLCASYIKKYYSTTSPGGIGLPPMRRSVALPPKFNRLQEELERSTEALSDAIARKRWKKARHVVIQLTHAAQQARNNFLNAMMPKRLQGKKRVPKQPLKKIPKGPFNCKRCTYRNAGGATCGICGYDRPQETVKGKSRPGGGKLSASSKISLPHTGEKKSSSAGISKQYATELTQLHAMGFSDDTKNTKALERANGNVQLAIQRILSTE
mmetsp:Transcript_34837/g.84254  ORF Transcript_34837/g.84254 Transcript_34837/m.84254 type:complete len:957 (+) Transcript_34837:146-3016(+)